MAKPSTPTPAPAPEPRRHLVAWRSFKAGDREIRRGTEIDPDEAVTWRNYRLMLGSRHLRWFEESDPEWRHMHRPKPNVAVAAPVRAAPDYMIVMCVDEAVALLRAGRDWNQVMNVMDSNIVTRAMGQFSVLYSPPHRRTTDGFWPHLRQRVEAAIKPPPPPPPTVPRPPDSPRPAARSLQ